MVLIVSERVFARSVNLGTVPIARQKFTVEIKYNRFIEHNTQKNLTNCILVILFFIFIFFNVYIVFLYINDGDQSIQSTMYYSYLITMKKRHVRCTCSRLKRTILTLYRVLFYDYFAKRFRFLLCRLKISIRVDSRILRVQVLHRFIN